MSIRSDLKAEVEATLKAEGEDANYNGLTYKTIRVFFPIRGVHNEVVLVEGSVNSLQLFAEAMSDDVEDLKTGGTLEIDGRTYNIINREKTKLGSTILELSVD